MTTYKGFISNLDKPSIGDLYPKEAESKMATHLNSNIAAPTPGSSERRKIYRSKTDEYIDRNKKEMLKKEKEKAKITVVKWGETSQPPATQQAELIPKHEVVKPDESKSLFTQQFENCRSMPHFRYMQYAKLDGTGFLELPRKSFKIFMTMLPEKYQNYPFHVCILAQAKIGDLIGLICYKFSAEHPEVSLGHVHDYGLCIADDDGEVDWDFPCFDIDDYCHKLGFRYLGLIELKKKPLSMATLLMSDDDISLASALDYRVPEPQKQARPKDTRVRDTVTINENILTADALQYCNYEVQLIRKLRTNLAVHLSISPETVEITPVALSRFDLWSRSQFYTHQMDNVAHCQVLKIGGKRTTFRIIYSENRKSSKKNSTTDQNYNVFGRNMIYKYHEIEADHSVAKSIVEKLNTLLTIRNSACRRDYKNPRERSRHQSSCFPCGIRWTCFT